MNQARWSGLKLLVHVFKGVRFAGLKINVFQDSYGKHSCTASFALPRPCSVLQIWSLFLPPFKRVQA